MHTIVAVTPEAIWAHALSTAACKAVSRLAPAARRQAVRPSYDTHTSQRKRRFPKLVTIMTSSTAIANPVARTSGLDIRLMVEDCVSSLCEEVPHVPKFVVALLDQFIAG